MKNRIVTSFMVVLLALGGCGDDASNNPDAGPPDAGPDASPSACETPPAAIPTGDANGHAEPLGSAPGQARAGRIRGADLPPIESKLLTWADGDFVLANDKVAIVIEDVGDSELYDPWG